MWPERGKIRGMGEGGVLTVTSEEALWGLCWVSATAPVPGMLRVRVSYRLPVSGACQTVINRHVIPSADQLRGGVAPHRHPASLPRAPEGSEGPPEGPEHTRRTSAGQKPHAAFVTHRSVPSWPCPFCHSPLGTVCETRSGQFNTTAEAWPTVRNMTPGRCEVARLVKELFYRVGVVWYRICRAPALNVAVADIRHVRLCSPCQVHLLKGSVIPHGVTEVPSCVTYVVKIEGKLCILYVDLFPYYQNMTGFHEHTLPANLSPPFCLHFHLSFSPVVFEKGLSCDWVEHWKCCKKPMAYSWV